MLEQVQWADWAPDGNNLAVVRDFGGRNRLELPVGKPLYETGGWIGHPRVSPKGDLIAFADHPLQGDDSGSLAVVDLAGNKKMLSSQWFTIQGVAWSPDGKEDLVHRQQVGHGSHALRDHARRQSSAWSRACPAR